MGMRVRVGPLSVSSRGRVGIHAGPVSVYGGGRRRRSRSSGSGAALIGFLAVLALVVVVVMWPLSLIGHAIGLTPSWHQLMQRNHAWEHQHYPLVGLRYLGTAGLLLVALTLLSLPLLSSASRQATERRRLAAEQAAERERQKRAAHEAWLAGPPPPLTFAGRFTQNWIAANVPHLHPGQISMLDQELRRRGWDTHRIQTRVGPYLPERR